MIIFLPVLLLLNIYLFSLITNGCFWIVVLEKTLESPSSARSNQSILKEISPECSLDGLMLKLKLQYFDHLMRRIDSLEKILMLGKIEGGRTRGNRGWDGWMASPTPWTWVWVSSGSSWWTGKPGVLQSMGSRRIGHDWVTELRWTCLFNYTLGEIVLDLQINFTDNTECSYIPLTQVPHC